MADVIAVRGDGVDSAFFRDGSGTAHITIFADCQTSHTSTVERPTFTITISRHLRSVTVELAGQAIALSRPSGSQGVVTFNAAIDVSGVEGALSGKIIARGQQTQTTTRDGNSSSVTHDWTTEKSFMATVIADTAAPTVQLVGLDAQTNSEASQTMRLAVTEAGSGLQSATWEIVGSGGGNLEPDGGAYRARVDWRTVTGSPRNVPAPVELPVLIRARDNARPNSNESTLAHTLRDAIAPSLQVDTPVPDAELANDGTGATVVVSGSVADHWSGVASLTLTLDDAPAIDLRPGQPPVTETSWSHTLRIPDFGHHRVVVRARDAAGNPPAEVTREFEIAAPLAVVAERDPFGPGSYLADLIDFAGRIVDVPGNDAASPTEPARRWRAAVEIGRVFHQPILRVAGSADTGSGAARNDVRSGIEIFQRVLDPTCTDLVAYWPLTDGAGPTAVDATGNGFTARAPAGSSPEWVAGRGSAPVPRFDGVAAELVVDEPGALTMRDSVSVAAWVRADGPGTGEVAIILNKEGEYSLGRSAAGDLAVIVVNQSSGWTWLPTGISLPVGEWVHVALVYDGASILAYRNGRLSFRPTSVGLIGTAAPDLQDVRLGGRLGVAQFEGLLSDVRLYRGAVPAATIARLAEREPVLQARWTLDRGSGPVDRDTVAARELALEGASWGLGRAGTALLIEAGQQAAADMAGIQPGVDDADFALAAWVFLAGEPGLEERVIFRQGAEGSRTVRVFLAAGAQAVTVRVRTASGTIDGPPPVPLAGGRWLHLACVKDGNQLVLYVDGAARLRHRLAEPVAGTDGPLVVGSNGANGVAGFTGSVADLRVYDGSLTAAEVATIVTEPETGRRAYLDAAYRTLLQLNGTSFDELRLMRGADRSTRERLAARLGIALRPGSPDELDDLLRPASLVTEQWLEETFGLVDTTRDPLTSPPPARLVGWRQAAVRTLWQEQDRADLAGTPIVDPTHVSSADLLDPAAVGSLLNDRAGELATRRADLAAIRAPGADPVAAFAATVQLGLAPVDVLLDLRDRRAAGVSVRSDLAALSLTAREFDRVLGLYDLAQRASIEPSEWRELDDTLVEVFRRRRLAAWRTAELTYLGGRPLVLSPDHFRLRSPSVGPAVVDARLDWEDRLASRIEQDTAILAANATTVADAEAIVLPILRDALAPAAACVLGVQGADELSQRLLLDATAGSSVTTPARQAAELVAGVLFGVRTGRIDDTHPAGTWSIPDLAVFDADWPWMSAVEAWQAAIAAFYYPENLLSPALRGHAALVTAGGQRSAFSRLLDGLRRRDSTTTQRVTDALDEYTAHRVTGPSIPNDVEGKLYAPDPTHADRHRALNDAITDAGGPPSALAQEVLYFVPITIALQLHRWGAYAQALDWFRLVYDDGAAGEQRKVYAGLRSERNAPRQRSRLDDWLRDLNPHALAGSQGGNPYTRFTVMALARCLLDFGDAEFTRDTPESRSRARYLYLAARELVADPDLRDLPASGALVLPPNPALELLALRVDNQLRKLREGRNIAGMKRPVEPEAPATGGVPAAATVGADGRIQLPSQRVLRPTGHRYAVLVERARRLVALSAQVEAAYLQALERQDTETYRELEAGHHLELAARGTELQRLRVTQARSGTELARRRQGRVRILQRTYGEWLDEGLNSWEEATVAAHIAGGVARATAIGLQAAAAIAQASVTAASAGPFAGAAMTAAVPFGILTGLGAAASGVAAAAETTAQVSSLQASFERRRDEWELQQGLANQDIVISDQEIVLATDQEQISSAEAATAQLQQTQSKAVADYLATRFLNAELYQWMSGVLADVYAHLLQQATATAQLAQQQLAFERQLPPVGFVKDDYWVAAGDDGAARDRRGLTGSARLLQDLEELDQYAFENDERKLNLSQTFSLASLAPFEFEQFRNTGVLPFSTPMSLFDRDFPGHYLRLIKRVRVSLVALVPPVRGIRATLAATGVSRVVVGGDSFREVTIRRDPEQVALSSPTGATGVFELDAQADLLAPFEAMGVHTSWEFRLPRAANPFSFDDIADVLVTIDYTALADDDYRQQVIAGFDRRVRADLAVSLRTDRPDQWYELHNPGEGARPFAVRFEIASTDFPPNVDDLEVAHVLLAVIRADGVAEPVEVDLRLQPDHGTATGPFGGTATSTADGVVSTRRAVGTPWLPMVGRSPVGTWELAFTGAIAPLVTAGAIQDVLLVVSFTGVTPPWPA